MLMTFRKLLLLNHSICASVKPTFTIQMTLAALLVLFITPPSPLIWCRITRAYISLFVPASAQSLRYAQNKRKLPTFKEFFKREPQKIASHYSSIMVGYSIVG